ncbi:MAG: pseudouridine synthase [Xanthomonadales bacterium]|nr:pseudouridine synthase [Xanthomonadales bacterium]
MLIAFHKPHGVLCQFTDPRGRPTLSGFIDVPQVYPAGRLDRDSEGLLLLTDDGALQHALSDPQHKTRKTYHVQVEGIPKRAALDRLRSGIRLQDGPCRPAEVRLLARKPAYIGPRDPPVRPRAGQPTNWLEIVLTEGRNRQVRRMTAAVGLPTLRLVRWAIGPIELGDLQQGQWDEVDPKRLRAVYAG